MRNPMKKKHGKPQKKPAEYEAMAADGYKASDDGEVSANLKISQVEYV